MEREIFYDVPPEYEGKKLVHFVRGFCGLSARLTASIKYTGLFINGEPARTIDRLHAGDKVKVVIHEEETSLEPVNCELDIIYEDDDLLIINKSPFMAMHPTHNHQGDTLANAVAAYLSGRGKSCTFRTLGRLDKGTSGVVICALNRLAACNTGRISKEYLALVSGELEGKGVIDVPIYRPDAGKTLRACSYEKGELPAVTKWEVLEKYKGATLVRVLPETGRTHQIRVHFAFTGNPLAGDTMYGSFMPETGHQLLHCHRVTFVHPVTGEEMTVTAPLQNDFEKTCEKLKNNS